MKTNTEKCHLLFSSKTPQVVSIGETTIISSVAETLLGTIIDPELNFENLISSMGNKVNRKTNALGCIANYKSLVKHRILLLSNMYSSNINNKITSFHEIALRIVYSDYTSSFGGLLNKDNSL